MLVHCTLWRLRFYRTSFCFFSFFFSSFFVLSLFRWREGRGIEHPYGRRMRQMPKEGWPSGDDTGPGIQSLCSNPGFVTRPSILSTLSPTFARGQRSNLLSPHLSHRSKLLSPHLCHRFSYGLNSSPLIFVTGSVMV